MCGIAGVLDWGGTGLDVTVERMLGTLEHRGPDGHGSIVEPPVALGHRRLAIIDLSDDGAQPMEDASGRFVMTYNGEIYNYVELRGELEQLGVVFRSSSDSEVLLAAYVAWGADCLPRLNGMFAFAIWDRVGQALFAARDRLGVKPLVYAWDGKRLGFASEHKALVAARLVSGAVAPDSVYEYIARGYTSGGRSFYAGIESLLPGHALSVDADGLRTWEWWQPNTTPDESLAFGEWVEAIGEIVQDSVRLRLRSDVPVGAHLSGGIDSSAIVAASARLGTKLDTFTGAFPEHPGSDERRFSRAVNEQFGLTGHEIEIGIDELAAVWDRLLWHVDEPLAGPSVFPQLLVCDLARDHGMKVVLGGQGGDELFGGYLRHRVLHHRRSLQRGSVASRIGSAAALTRLVLPQLRRIRRTSTRVQDPSLSPAFLDLVDPAVRAEARRPRMSAGSAGELMLWDLRNYLRALLDMEDRTSMAASIESRTPLLDYRLVELVLRIPERHHFGGRDAKPLLRRAVSPWLPPSVAKRRDKRGFPTPLEGWRQRPALAALVDSIFEPIPSEIPVFSPEYLARRDGFTQSELWTVLMIKGWIARGPGSPARVPTAASG